MLRHMQKDCTKHRVQQPGHGQYKPDAFAVNKTEGWTKCISHVDKKSSSLGRKITHMRSKHVVTGWPWDHFLRFYFCLLLNQASSSKLFALVGAGASTTTGDGVIKTGGCVSKRKLKLIGDKLLPNFTFFFDTTLVQVAKEVASIRQSAKLVLHLRIPADLGLA